MIKFLLNNLHLWLKNRKMPKMTIIICIVVITFFLLCFFLDNDTPVTGIIEHTAYIRHESERNQRVVEAIDKRKDAEIDALKKNTVNDADVLDVLTNLLGTHSGK